MDFSSCSRVKFIRIHFLGPTWGNASWTPAWWPSIICRKVVIYLIVYHSRFLQISAQGFPVRVRPTPSAWNGSTRGPTSTWPTSWQAADAPSSVYSKALKLIILRLIFTCIGAFLTVKYVNIFRAGVAPPGVRPPPGASCSDRKFPTSPHLHKTAYYQSSQPASLKTKSLSVLHPQAHRRAHVLEEECRLHLQCRLNPW